MPPGLPAYDRRALTIEIELLVDWYWPWAKKAPAPASSRAACANVWAPLIAAVAVDTTNASGRRAALVLRDYHSPNLMWLPDRDGARRIGIIDFQDAVAGHPAYDLVSLAQDARIDVPANLEADLIERHCRALATRDAAFDEAAFRTAYAILGAQRATKILGIFARLSQRDGKHGYLAHMPRIWGYLMRNLAHPSLAALAEWYDQSFEPAERGAPATASTSPEHS